MSQAGPKITSKNLTYDTTLPPFLARLRGQQQQYSEDGPDPILAARRRPQGKPRSVSEEAEDAPVVVDERGNVVQLRDGAIVDDDGDAGDVGQRERGAEVEKADGDAAEKREEGEEEEEARRRDAEKVAGIGAGRKRKVGRVVGAAGSGSGAEDDQDDDGNGPKKKGARADDADAKANSTATAPKKKKAKKIKLSFGDDGE
ncbi:hypothetical protein DL770_001610 [Monosporascus sp. CRB-9-2]|nr:hypothetical protein DL770_001610 [Monosporascus sp. CRB-9-2]